MMKKAAILLAVFGVFLVFGGCRVEAASYQTFYRDYDERVRTKEQYLAKLEKSREMRATREEILHSARFAFRRDFTSWKEYREFIRGEEVTVAPCTFKDTRVDYLVLRPRGIGQQRRDHRKRELCLRHQGGDRISLLCGQGIMDPRRVLPAQLPTPKVSEEKKEEKKAKEKSPEKPFKLGGPVRTVEKKDECREYGVATTVVPSPGFDAGVYGRGSFAGMSFDSYHTYQQAHCVRY